MTSWWITDAETEHLPHSRPLPDRCDVAVIGAGLVGLTAARELLLTGADVQVIDAAPVLGSGVSGQSTAKVTVGTGLRLDEVRAAFGQDAAQEFADAGVQGLGMARDILERNPWVRASVVPHHLYATTPPGVGRIEDHADLARACGLHVRRCDPPFPWASASVAYDDQIVVQPVDVVHALATEVSALHGRITLSTTVTDVRPGDLDVEVVTSRGTLRADRVVLATHVPLNDSGRTFLHWRQKRHRALVGRAAGPVPTTYDVDAGWSTRPVGGGDGGLTVVVGAAHDVGGGHDLDARDELRDWASEHLGLTALHEWATQDATSLDSLPLVGRLGSGLVLTATGFGGWGWAHGLAAGQELARLVRASEPRWPSFAITSRRFGHGTARHAANLGEVAQDAVTGHLRLLGHLGSEAPVEVRPGEGVVRLQGGRATAVSVDGDGTRRTVAARCTHLGCLVGWNEADESWDCPCHGSRFAPDGSVLHGPATTPLETLDD